jgi:hypothetical protein
MAAALSSVMLASQLPPVGPDRYLVTTSPIPIKDPGPQLCVGVDPTTVVGVWWWQAGRTGCDSRMTSPDVFPGLKGAVTASADQSLVDIRFELGMHDGPPLNVHLTVHDGRMFVVGPDAPPAAVDGVPVQRRSNLDLPLIPPD